MTNLEKLRSLSAEDLAPLLVECHSEETEDYDWDDNPIAGPTIDVYVTTDGSKYWDDEDSAIEHEIEWLKQEEKITNGQ